VSGNIPEPKIGGEIAEIFLIIYSFPNGMEMTFMDEIMRLNLWSSGEVISFFTRFLFFYSFRICQDGDIIMSTFPKRLAKIYG